MTDPPVRFSVPAIGEEEIDEVVETLRSGWLTTGPRTQQFERAFAEAVGAPAALALNSCTAAMHVALKAMGVGPGDAVVTTAVTFCSTANVVEHCGARLVLADVEPDTLNISPEAVARALDSEDGAGVKVLLPVHFAGHPVDLDAILEIAAARGLAVLEDAAHAVPARTATGATIGSVDGDVARAVAFSFYATKNLTTGEGGMLTASPDLVDEARIWSLHGMSRDAWRRYDGASWHYDVTRAGFKYNMTDVAAALGLWQLRKLDSLQKRRYEVVARYDRAFADLGEVEPPASRAGIEHAWHLYVLRLHLDRLKIDRARFIEELKERGVHTSVHFIPLHHHAYYRDRYGYAPDDYPVANREFERSLSLPLHAAMTDDEVDRVVAAVTDVAAINRR